jgi:sortase A
VLILLFLGWKLWLNDIIVGSSQNDAASALSEEWSLDNPTPSPSAPASTSPSVAAPIVLPSKDAPPVMAKPAASAAFASLLAPRFGADYRRTISHGVGLDVLNDSAAGIGHYPASQLPGAVGNFAVAGHRTTYGKSFRDINTFVPGDHLFVETKAGWYRYVYRNTVYVYPTGVDVLNVVPQMPQGSSGDRIMTLTSCNPLFSAAERIIAYAVFDAWFPRSGGIPNELSDLATSKGK